MSITLTNAALGLLALVGPAGQETSAAKQRSGTDCSAITECALGPGSHPLELLNNRIHADSSLYVGMLGDTKTAVLERVSSAHEPAELPDLTGSLVQISGDATPVQTPGGFRWVPAQSIGQWVLAFVPAEKLIEGASYQLIAGPEQEVATADTPLASGCIATAESTILFEVTPRPPTIGELVAPKLTLELDALIERPNDNDIASLVCCDGAYPVETFDDCGQRVAAWEAGHCEATRLTREAHVSLTLGSIANDKLPSENLTGVRAVRASGNDFGNASLAKTTGTIVVVHDEDRFGCWQTWLADLHAGTVVYGEKVCLESETVATLGNDSIEPSFETCEGTPYNCEVQMLTADVKEPVWDPERCLELFPSDCNCSVPNGEHTPWYFVAMVLAIALGLRSSRIRRV